MFDEPSSYLDIKQQIKPARAIRRILSEKDIESSIYIFVVEHDLSILDYLFDFVRCIYQYGKPGVYGVVMFSGVREGINDFLKGFIPTETIRFEIGNWLFLSF